MLSHMSMTLLSVFYDGSYECFLLQLSLNRCYFLNFYCDLIYEGVLKSSRPDQEGNDLEP